MFNSIGKVNYITKSLEINLNLKDIKKSVNF